jgi:gluconokinase
MNIPGLRSPYEKVGGLLHFGRMLDKIRLHRAGKLPADYHANLGGGFDARLCGFLGVKYEDVVARVKLGGEDLDILNWCLQSGRRPSEEEIEVFNDFLRKRGWNDAASDRLAVRVKELGPEWAGKIHTFFDLIEADEGRSPRSR